MEPTTLIVAILATWRITALLYYDYGPWDVFLKLRERAGVWIVDENGKPVTFWGKLFTCFWCLSLWVGLCVTPLALWCWWILLPFALSGAAVLLSGGGRVIWRTMAE